MSSDAVTFAIAHGYWKGAADDPAFSFSDTYDPVTFEGARFCEARGSALPRARHPLCAPPQTCATAGAGASAAGEAMP